ncbi:3-oxoacyl-[acyl-carrier protein] reductase [Anaerobacterium chartisolvens]|uniref:3-oxoacyl-[acyl-carrier protein] reductase n=1 Tax=Anaerobacterium chartisolvens TaxID=1297424 RepID=A0A369AJM8_9FIRM|nr:3-oxoacyl-ACP reductase FabG [Anaerobacterium chartisolvens]RCX09293.1 3-oxoacyl-[acyl-carrier protein] reductase [Anaerobacterium chartisolvens]
MKKTVLITGASRGIGRATAELFAYRGCNVLINYNSSHSDAAELVSVLKGNGFEAELFKADVSARGQVDRMLEYCAERFGGIDILVNNAAISDSRLFTEITQSEWDRMLDINLKGVFNCTQSALKYMLPQKRGVIINVASMWGETGGACEVHYSASKAGIIGFTKALAKELGPSGIRVNCISPGVIQTDMLKEYDRDSLEELKSSAPLMRLGTAGDVASGIFYLSSDEADFITGQVLGINGGMVI